MPATEAPAPTIRPQTQPPARPLAEILPPYQVVLHNDDVNLMDHVVRALVASIPRLGVLRATGIMLEAHTTGRARVTVCPKELAELYRERLQSYRLTATIEPA